MRTWSWGLILKHLGVNSSTSIRRIVKQSSVWNFEIEQLESRALLSAASRNVWTDVSSAEIATVSRKAQPVFPNVAGTWNVVTTSEYFGSGTVTMTQSGKTVNLTVTLEDLPTFTVKATFKRHSPNELTAKSKRIEVPGSAVLVRLAFKIDFATGNQSPTTFNATVNAPVIPKPLDPPPLASLQATKAL